MESEIVSHTTMKTKLTLLAAAIVGAVAFTTTVSHAAEPDRTIIPLPEPTFAGKIGKTYKDSTAAWPKLPAPPAGSAERARDPQTDSSIEGTGRAVPRTDTCGHRKNRSVACRVRKQLTFRGSY